MRALTFLVVALSLVWFAGFFGLNQDATVSITRFSVALVLAGALAGTLATAVDFVLDSREERTESAIALLKRAQPKIWVVRLVGTTALAAAWCATSLYLLLSMLVPYRPGAPHVFQGTIAGLHRAYRMSPCHDAVYVVFDGEERGNEHRLCYRSGLMGTRVIADGQMTAGAKVDVTFVRNSLGVAVTRIARIDWGIR